MLRIVKLWKYVPKPGTRSDWTIANQLHAWERPQKGTYKLNVHVRLWEDFGACVSYFMRDSRSEFRFAGIEGVSYFDWGMEEHPLVRALWLHHKHCLPTEREESQ